MKKLALSEKLLLSIQQPARYLGNEMNAVIKDRDKVDIRFAMCFPDVYEIGMSHLGIQILYAMFNERDDVWCERVFSPWTDLDRLMREQNIPLFALESQDPVKDFDFLGITLQYEMCYTNVLQILDLAQIHISAADRTEKDPIVIGGGPCAYNPEPLAEFFDIFYIGDGETSYDALLNLYKDFKAMGKTRKDFLLAAAKIPGIYVPSLYRAEYNEDGTLKSFTPTCEGVPAKVRKQAVEDLDGAPYVKKPIVPFIKVTQDRVVLELMRGCMRGCRFCQAGMIYRPKRERSPQRLKDMASEMLLSTGHEEITLSSLSSSDYTGLEEVLKYLLEEFGSKNVNIALPSLRIDAFSLDVMGKIQDVKKSSLTFAPEAGSQRLRNVINKGLTEQDILGGALLAFKGGWNRVKLYFMLGLPTETEEDMLGIPDLSEKIAELYYDEIPKEERNGKVQIVASSSFFVPKPFTPFQWSPMCTYEEFYRRAYLVKDAFKTMKNHKSLKYNYHDADVTVLEGLLARGDRRLSELLKLVYARGALFDAWTESFKKDIWDEALSETKTDLDFYVYRTRETDELLPWDFIDCGVTKEFLVREWEKAQKAVVTPNCRDMCSGCGASIYPGGICLSHGIRR